jgi:hypothetical protein
VTGETNDGRIIFAAESGKNERQGASEGGLSGLSGLFGSSGSSHQTDQRNQMNKKGIQELIAES